MKESERVCVLRQLFINANSIFFFIIIVCCRFVRDYGEYLEHLNLFYEAILFNVMFVVTFVHLRSTKAFGGFHRGKNKFEKNRQLLSQQWTVYDLTKNINEFICFYHYYYFYIQDKRHLRPFVRACFATWSRR